MFRQKRCLRNSPGVKAEARPTNEQIGANEAAHLREDEHDQHEVLALVSDDSLGNALQICLFVVEGDGDQQQLVHAQVDEVDDRQKVANSQKRPHQRNGVGLRVDADGHEGSGQDT